VSGVEAGSFPNHPVATSTSPRWECQYCDPDRLGVIELRARWERKRTDPALAGYADRVEPEGGVGDRAAGDGGAPLADPDGALPRA